MNGHLMELLSIYDHLRNLTRTLNILQTAEVSEGVKDKRIPILGVKDK